MYVSYYQDNKLNRLFVSERINGQRCYSDFPLILEYYVPDNNGYYMGYDGIRLKIILRHMNLISIYQIKYYMNIINKVKHLNYINHLWILKLIEMDLKI